MSDRDVEQIKNIAHRINALNSKIKLIALLEKAHDEFNRSNYNESEEICKKILRTNPNNSVALRGLGCIYQAKQEYQKALEYYQKALVYSEKKEIEYTFIGTIFYIEENLEEAIKYFNLAIEENDSFESAYEGRNQSMLEYHLKIVDLQDSLIRQKIF